MSKCDLKRLGDYIREVDVRNSDGSISAVDGINIDKYFFPTVANLIGTDLTKYKLVGPRQFACNFMHVGRDEKLPVALNYNETPILVSPAYHVFEITKQNLLPEFLALIFRQKNFDRKVWFHTDGDVRGGMNWRDFCDLEITIPPIEEQREIVARHKAIERRIEINRKTIARLEESAQAIYRKMFVDDIDPENLPDGWRMGKLSEISLLICRGKSPDYNDNSPQTVIGQRCVRNHCVSLLYSRKHNAKTSHIDLQFGDILINSTGLGSLGRVGQIFFNPTNTSYDSHVTLVRTAPHLMLYVGAYLFTQEKSIEDLAKGSTGQTELAVDDVKDYSIIIPTKDIANEFNSRISPIIKYSEILRLETEKYQYILSNILR